MGNDSNLLLGFAKVWLDGGWVMIPLFAVSFMIYFTGLQLLAFLGRARVRNVPDAVMNSWIANPDKVPGHAGDVIRFVLGGGDSADSVRNRLEEVRLRSMPTVNSKLTMLNNLVATAPLMGLLGTVMGMLTTFRGLAASSGQTVGLVASGIQEALITTQTGLMVAIPGYVMISFVLKRRSEYASFLMRIEANCVQKKQKGEQAA